MPFARVGLDPSGWVKLLFRDYAFGESVSPRVKRGIRNREYHEIQLKSLILAQPERWRRG